MYVSEQYSPIGVEGWLHQIQPRNNGVWNERTKMQEFRPYNSAATYTRQLNWDTQTWSTWSRLDNFGCNTPADLASLLGGRVYIPMNEFDYNDMVGMNISTYYFSANSPLDVEGFLLVDFLRGSSPTNIQRFYQYNGNICKWRMWNWSEEVWTEWKDI